MFEIGDIVKLNEEKVKIFGPDWNQSFKIISINNKFYEIFDIPNSRNNCFNLLGLKDNTEKVMYVDNVNFELDLILMRKQSLEKICSKLET